VPLAQLARTGAAKCANQNIEKSEEIVIGTIGTPHIETRYLFIGIIVTFSFPPLPDTLRV
jgi:hypothetical protein